MPIGAARLTLLAFQAAVEAEAEVIRASVGISANGNAQVDTAESKFGGASALFDGTGDYLQMAPDDAFAVGTGDITIDFWFKSGNINLPGCIIDLRPGSNGFWPALFMPKNDQGMFLWWNGARQLTHQTALSDTNWHHAALVRDNGDWTIYLDGVGSTASYNSSGSIGSSSYARIGANFNLTNYANAHIEELRISNNVRYTANFTPPTAPNINDENTLLLLHMDGTDGTSEFVDDNGTGRSRVGVGAYGTRASATISTSQSKFGGTSGYFNDKELDMTSPDFAFGTGDFTIEGWIYTTVSQNAGMFQLSTDSDYWPTSSNGLAIGPRVDNGNTWSIYKNGGVASLGTCNLNTWYHVALSRSSGVIKFFVDGVEEYSAADTNNYSGQHLFLGGYWDYQFRMDGYIDEFRISNTARYTTGFTPHTEPHVNDANTLLLLHMDGSNASNLFLDDNGSRAKIGVTSLGSAQVDTAQSKFGGASAYFGTGEDALATSGIDQSAWSSTWTYECWFRLDSIQDNQYLIYNRGIIWITGPNRSTHPSEVIIALSPSPSNSVSYYTTFTPISGGWQTDQWYHIAVTHNNGTTEVFVDGTSLGSLSSHSYLFADTLDLEIGKHPSSTGNDFNGYMDEIRISKSVRYTANFTPPTEPFQNDSDTILLLHTNGTDGSFAFIDDNA